MALLFGTTWVVNAIVVSGLLALVVIANLFFECWPSYSMAIPYAGIILSAVLAYFIPLHTLLFESVSLRITVATLLLCMPIFFAGDRKSTRLNSSHQIISYAVFCLKKKN